VAARLPGSNTDRHWLAAAAALAVRARPLSRPNPAVGAILVKNGIVVGRGWTQPGGRPHAEAMALTQAGSAAQGATLYVTLEPCAHDSARGPCCAGLVRAAGVERVVAGMEDPDPRTAGAGIALLLEAGIAASCVADPSCRNSLAGYLLAKRLGRPLVTLKLAITADGFIARPDGTSKWITGDAARAHVHVERAMNDAILVGGGTVRADAPRLDVRLAGLEHRSPQRIVLTRGEAPDGWTKIASPADIASLEGVQYLFVEGGAVTARAFLEADLVDRLLLYRAPVTFGGGISAFADAGPAGVPEGWRLADRRTLGSDTLEVYLRA